MLCPGCGSGRSPPHLAFQITQVPAVLEAPVEHGRIGLTEHFARSTWTDGDLDSEVNTFIRASAAEAALAGPAVRIEEAAAALEELRRRLPGEPADRVIQLPFGPWALTLDDYLTTRLLELAVHGDDLAASVGVASPPLPAPCLESVVTLLCAMATRKYGTATVIRALSRAERSPRTIAAL
ncbi:maleylpyruvate isomerase N-terminal domain-containing protein [Actinoplanes sp. NPDC023714]|uniref:maleylpyruvate isomerase N-terminal domain-containing protein n=1 Tax=Actinoplanes sp. NPDC023714 TaxID=3154322 RepID=UPI00340E35D6